MRYSFHGKMRFTGQMVDGFIEANNSMEAIDLLADQGIIGVYTVFPVPVQPKTRLTFDAFAPTSADWDMSPELQAEPLIDRLSTLIGQVEQILASRPVLPGPVSSVRSLARRSSSKPVAEEQGAALRAIFESNLELRQRIGQASNSTALLESSEKSQPNPSRELSNRMINVLAQPAA